MAEWRGNSGQVARAEQQHAQHGRPEKAAHRSHDTDAHLFGLATPHHVLHQDAGAGERDDRIIKEGVFFRGNRRNNPIATDDQARQGEPTGEGEEQHDGVVKHGRFLSRFGARLVAHTCHGARPGPDDPGGLFSYIKDLAAALLG